MGSLRKSQKCVFAIVITLGCISALLGFLAEAYRIKGSQIMYVNNQCVYPHSPALILGVAAALFLLTAQVFLNVAGGCICCTHGPPPPPHSVAASNRSIAIICLVACWITFLNAFALLMAGASLNNQHEEYMWFSGECNIVKPLVFAGGALLALATVVLGLIFYLAACVARASVGANAVPAQPSNQHPHPHIAVGHPYPPYYGHHHSGHLSEYRMNPFHSTSMPSQIQMQGIAPPNASQNPAMGYPDVVTGYPKPLSPTQRMLTGGEV